MTIEQAILEKVRVLSPQKQQEVLAFIDLLQADEWEKLYKGRFEELQQQIHVGIEAADRGELVDAEEVFQRLGEKLQQKRAQAGQ
jgi:predicted transcriptional regulator